MVLRTPQGPTADRPEPAAQPEARKELRAIARERFEILDWMYGRTGGTPR